MAEAVSVLLMRSTAVRRIVDRIPGGIDGLTCARDADLVELMSAAQSVVLSAQGVLAAVAGEISRRSVRGSENSLAKRLGEPSATALIAHRAGIPFGEALRAVEVGEAIRPNAALSGENLPADREDIATAVLGGELSLGLAHLIDETLGKVAPALTGAEALDLEQALVRRATSGTLSIAQMTRLLRRLPDRLDPDGSVPRERYLREKAGITETMLANGLLRVVADLDPERAAYYRAAMNARTNPRRDRAEDDSTREEARRGGTRSTRMERRLDAFASIVRDSLKADDGGQGGVDTTILVRIDLQDLLAGIGTATIDGIDSPISAATARRMAVDADVIPQVFGGRSVLLDHGESRRIFSKAQRYAILGMFSGCAFPQCDMPTAMTEMHHVGSWATRHDHRHGTDLLNGLPLCGFHNRLMEEGWSIEFDDDHVPWFTPPSTVDPLRRPLPGGGFGDRRAA